MMREVIKRITISEYSDGDAVTEISTTTKSGWEGVRYEADSLDEALEELQNLDELNVNF